MENIGIFAARNKNSWIMTAVQIDMALEREIGKIRGNEEAMRRMLEAARLIRLMYMYPTAFADFEAQQESAAEAEAEQQFRSLRGCWADDPEDAALMEAAILEARASDIPREINLDD